MTERERAIAVARDAYECDSIEIDDYASVFFEGDPSGNRACWVSAWVYVPERDFRAYGRRHS